MIRVEALLSNKVKVMNRLRAHKNLEVKTRQVNSKVKVNKLKLNNKVKVVNRVRPHKQLHLMLWVQHKVIPQKQRLKLILRRLENTAGIILQKLQQLLLI